MPKLKKVANIFKVQLLEVIMKIQNFEIEEMTNLMSKAILLFLSTNFTIGTRALAITLDKKLQIINKNQEEP